MFLNKLFHACYSIQVPFFIFPRRDTPIIPAYRHAWIIKSIRHSNSTSILKNVGFDVRFDFTTNQLPHFRGCKRLYSCKVRAKCWIRYCRHIKLLFNHKDTYYPRILKRNRNKAKKRRNKKRKCFYWHFLFKRCVRDSNSWPPAWQAGILTYWTNAPFHARTLTLRCVRDSNSWPPAWQAGILTYWTNAPC